MGIAAFLEEQGLLRLLEIKDSDIRIMTIEQGFESVDRGIHAGGAFSAVIPLVSLYYGGIIRADVEDPTRPGQDLFVLSKGHAVATLASIYADLGYFPLSTLKNSRSMTSVLNGHPGPILPGIHLSTGPLGQGLAVAQGFALAGKRSESFDVYCMTGDGEMQEGTIWEAIMYSGARRLENLCLVVDKNEGQLDNPRQLHFSMSGLHEQLAAFGWRVYDLDATRYEHLLSALRTFRFQPRDGRPTAIIANTRKGFGVFSSFLTNHKVELSENLVKQELALQEQLRSQRVQAFLSTLRDCMATESGEEVCRRLRQQAAQMNLTVTEDREIERVTPRVKTRPSTPRRKQVTYSTSDLPQLDPSRPHSAAAVVTAAMKVFARDSKVVSIDADLSTTSGLQEGVAYVDTSRALNVGAAEANMMCIGEAYAILGHNVWVSTFCPFFNSGIMRRIAISYQERLEVMDHGGWLSAGSGLDLTFLATAPDFETRTNGATHMGNDDVTLLEGMAHLKIVSLSCPNQVLAFMRWVMAGNRGLVYARILRAPAPILYGPDVEFEYARGYWLMRSNYDKAYLISSGRGSHEALAAAQLLKAQGIPVGVVDLPSFDKALLLSLHDSGKPMFIAEQNNGFIASQLRKTLFLEREVITTRNLVSLNTLDSDGSSRFLHSATYEQLLHALNLSAEQIADRVRDSL